MTPLTLDDFKEFFGEAHKGAQPFPWQMRLVKQLLETGHWPEQIAVPTGGGKTSVIDAHVFAVAAMVSEAKVVVPRRLALIVPRRVLVDSQYEHARDLAELLKKPSSPVLRQVADALQSLRWSKAPDSDSPLVVARIRGGLPAPRAWRDDPVACAVLSCTPDMWGSRLLLHGYGSSPKARPREAGLMAFDTVAVVDEAHLCRQLLVTARSVAKLEDTVDEELNVPTLQVIEVTATPTADKESVLKTTQEDLDIQVLNKRLCTPKPVEILRTTHWPAKPDNRYDLVNQVKEKVVDLRKSFGPTVGVFVNTVRMAIDVADKLRKTEFDRKPLSVVLVCGRLRDHDVEQIRNNYPGLLDLAGNEAVDVLVTTQSLEVGVDLDLSAALSELAPGGALAQRAGRVNRLGKRESTRFVVVVPKNVKVPKTEKKGEWGPYTADELQEALEWLQKRENDSYGISPSALRECSPPVALQRRTLYQRVELADSWWWSRTSDDVDPQPELDLWLDDNLESEMPEAGIVVRHALPEDSTQAVELLRALPPRSHEVFPAPLWDVRKILEQALKEEWGTILVSREDEIDVVSHDNIPRFRPGDILILDDKAIVFTFGVAVPEGKEGMDDVLKERMDDVLEAKRNPGPGDVVLRIDASTWGENVDEVLKYWAEWCSEGMEPRQARNSLAGLLMSMTEQSPMVEPAAKLLKGRIKECDVIPFYEDEQLVRLVVVDQRRAVSDDIVRQTWTPSDKPVLLNNHCTEVGERAQDIAERIGLDDEMIKVLAQAGLYHDKGKEDPRFQVEVLGNTDIEEPCDKEKLWAKSLSNSASRNRSYAKLPVNWRHEQLSVLKAWEKLINHNLPQHYRDLVLRLIGTSHGYGRASFPHISNELGPDEKYQNLAIRLFDEGEWDEIIERTHRRFGVWACAYLEALLRAADGQVSGEGS
jgi:CRISPR-associated endonuclease/helicase Cas3